MMFPAKDTSVDYYHISYNETTEPAKSAGYTPVDIEQSLN
jgi:hypothetical protein